jgi:hypothetical protein
MNKKLKRKWVAALRGGTYRQVIGSFGYWGQGPGPGSNKRCAISILSEIICRDGFSPNDMGPRAHEAMVLNDDGWTFLQIADWVEETL